MDAEELRDYCLSLAGTDEEFPFGPDTSAFKVAGKIFALSRLADDPLCVSLKCDPTTAGARLEHRSLNPSRRTVVANHQSGRQAPLSESSRETVGGEPGSRSCQATGVPP